MSGLRFIGVPYLLLTFPSEKRLKVEVNTKNVSVDHCGGSAQLPARFE